MREMCRRLLGEGPAPLERCGLALLDSLEYGLKPHPCELVVAASRISRPFECGADSFDLRPQVLPVSAPGIQSCDLFVKLVNQRIEVLGVHSIDGSWCQ